MLSQTTRPESVHKVLDTLRGLDPLKKLFWTELGYDRVNQPLSPGSWTEAERDSVADDPILFASAGANDEFQVIYIRLASDRLLQTVERPIVTRLLKTHPYALFIFSDHSQSHWHFLNVKYDPKSEKRILFRRIAVGPEERHRTASERLAMLDLESIKGGRTELSPLAVQQRHDDAFDVEVVTKKFFEQYRLVFERVEKLIGGIEEADRRRLFTQRLFNRLMFIAFIQKKGWLALGGDLDYLPALWSSYRRDATTGKNFYNDRLRLLFFAGLNTSNEINVVDINKRGVLQTLIGEVPYLNGGLFEEDEDDRNPDLVVPDKCFDGILDDLFDRFNFTVTESTPFDVEVAVDPEMLGKVFEELVTGRHEIGSYYTPKPIVSFMSREALKGYLKDTLPAEAPAAIDAFVDAHTPTELRDPEGVLEALRRIRVCDPACGSGAYLLGMLHELLDLRAALFATTKIDQLSTYQRKLEIIQSNVYGVDIDPFAINIARLRLWLSLAVDYEGSKPEPLPNLDFKIEAGDSLTAPDPTGGLQLDMYRDLQIKDYFNLKANYLQAHGEEKKSLRGQIDDLRTKIAEWAHPKGRLGGFDWQVEFAEVFGEGGFDIIVANPPYVRMELFKDIKPVLKANFPQVHSDRADLYIYFYGRALQLLRSGGVLAFISSNKWLRSGYGANLRKYLVQSCHIISMTDFGDLPVFEEVDAYPMIFIAQKAGSGSSTLFTEVIDLEAPYPDVLAVTLQYGSALPSSALSGVSWMLTDSASAQELRSMSSSGVSLGTYVKGEIYYGVKTGLNAAFIINGSIRSNLIADDPGSLEVIKPLIMGKGIRKWTANQSDKWLLYMYHGIDGKRFPAVLAHLQKYREHLENRATQQEWYELQQPQMRYAASFEKPKIIYPDIAKQPRFALDCSGLYAETTVFLFPTDDRYLLAILNSRPVAKYFAEIGAEIRGGYLRFKRQYVEQIPIPDAPSADRIAIGELVQNCVDAKGTGCVEWEQEIDERVARLYGL